MSAPADRPAARPARSVPSCHSEATAWVGSEDAPVVALVGSPNVGKSTLYNAVTGLRRDVGNWPGTTVAVGRGVLRLPSGDAALLDLPGAYSLDPLSPDEELTRALLVDQAADERPDVVVVTVSAAHLSRGLYLLAQLRETDGRLVAGRHHVRHRRKARAERRRGRPGRYRRSPGTSPSIRAAARVCRACADRGRSCPPRPAADAPRGLRGRRPAGRGR